MAKARVKQLPTTDANVVNRVIGNQKDRGKGELARLRESLKAQSRRANGKKARRSWSKSARSTATRNCKRRSANSI